MTLVVTPEEGFSKWSEKKADLFQLAKAQKHEDHVLHRFKWAYLLHVDSDQFDGGKQPEDHSFYSEFRSGDRYVDRSDEAVEVLLSKFKDQYNIHVEAIKDDWDHVFPLLDQMVEKYWGRLGAMFIKRAVAGRISIIFTCTGVDLATDIGKTVASLFGQFETVADIYTDGRIHVHGPVFYSGGRIFWHSFMRTMGFSTVAGPKYQIFEEIQQLAKNENFFGVSNLVALLSRFWDKKTHFGLYIGQSKLEI